MTVDNKDKTLPSAVTQANLKVTGQVEGFNYTYTLTADDKAGTLVVEVKSTKDNLSATKKITISEFKKDTKTDDKSKDSKKQEVINSLAEISISPSGKFLPSRVAETGQVEILGTKEGFNYSIKMFKNINDDAGTLTGVVLSEKDGVEAEKEINITGLLTSEENKKIIEKDEKNSIEKDLDLYNNHYEDIPFRFQLKKNINVKTVADIKKENVELVKSSYLLSKWNIEILDVKPTKNSANNTVLISYSIKSRKYTDISINIKDQEFLFIAPNKLLNFVYNGNSRIDSKWEFKISDIKPSLKNFKIDQIKSGWININNEEIFVKLVFTAEDPKEFMAYLKFSINENKFTIISQSEFDNLISLPQ
nr:lipoprotein 17-related variable surface protein [[Mycoplasma] phocae]